MIAVCYGLNDVKMIFSLLNLICVSVLLIFRLSIRLAILSHNISYFDIIESTLRSNSDFCKVIIMGDLNA